MGAEVWPFEWTDQDDTRGEVEREFDVELTLRVRVCAVGVSDAENVASTSSANWRDWDVLSIGTVTEVK